MFDITQLANMDISDMEALTVDEVLNMNPGEVEVTTTLPGLTGIMHCTGTTMRPIAGQDGKDNMLFVDLELTIKEVTACADSTKDPESFVGRKHTEGFNIANEMGLAALMRTLCNIAGVDASDKEARAAMGGTVGEVVKELALGEFYFKAKVIPNKKNPDYVNLSRKSSDFAPA